MSATIEAGGLVAPNMTKAACADCGTPAPGKHCPSCGQKTQLDRSLGSMVHNLLHDLAHVDGRLWRTVPLLAWRPGLLTRRYIDGQRTRYAGPNVIFLGSAFVMFLAFNLLPGPPAAAPCNTTSSNAVQRAGAEVREQLEQLGPQVKSILPPASPTRATPAVQWLERHAPAAYLARLEKALRNPEMAISKVKQKAYKMGFLLIPLSLPALWLLLGRRPGVRPYDLVVFSLYSIGFMSFLLTIILLLAGLSIFAWPLYIGMLLTIPPLHFFVHLRDSFALSKAEAIWQTAALCAIAVVSMGLFLLLVLVWGILF